MRNSHRGEEQIGTDVTNQFKFRPGQMTEPRLDLTEEDFFENNEEYAYIFDGMGWICYDLHNERPQFVEIPTEVKA